LLIEIKALAEEYATDQLAPYIEHVKKPYVSFGAKEINDALWGTIRLSPLEAAILDSLFLQRLRSIRQLGVVHWVYQQRHNSGLQGKFWLANVDDVGTN